MARKSFGGSFWGSFGCAGIREAKPISLMSSYRRGMMKQKGGAMHDSDPFQIFLFCKCDARVTVTTVWVCWACLCTGPHIGYLCPMQIHLAISVWASSISWWGSDINTAIILLGYEENPVVQGFFCSNEEYLCVYTQTLLKVQSFCKWTFSYWPFLSLL